MIRKEAERVASVWTSGQRLEDACLVLSSICVGHKTPAERACQGRTLLRENFNPKYGGRHMLRWAAIFFVIAIIAALLGFTGVAGAAANIAVFLFYLFVAIFVILLLLGLFAGRRL
jgi:uncharacterized membrane protein YtjA (UPF0391 family)